MARAHFERLALCTLIAQGLACSDRNPDQERTSHLERSLQVRVSAELDVERYPEIHPVKLTQPSVMACGSVRCAVFYKLGGYVYASRVDQYGQIVDRPPIVVGRGGAPMTAAASNDDFVAIWGEPADPHVFRLSGADGRATDLTANLQSARSGAYSLASNGNTWLLLDGNRAYVKSKDTFESIGNPAEVPIRSVPIILGGQGQYLVAWENRALRISDATGALLDTAPIEFSKHGDVSVFPQGAYRDGVYLLTWTGGDKVYGSRIRAGDGVRLHPDDDANQLSGADVICSGQPGATMRRAQRWSDSVLVTWEASPSELSAARVDVATGARISGSPSAREFAIAGETYSLHLADNWGMSLGNSEVVPFQVQQAPPRVIAGTPKPCVFSSDERLRPSVASNGAGFLVSWVVQTASASQVVGSRMNASGQYLDDPPLVFGNGGQVAVAARGSDYLVAWTSTTNQIQRRFVAATGQLEPTLPSIGSNNSSAVQLIHNGRYFLLTWLDYPSTIKTTRLRSDGTALDPGPITLATGIQTGFATLADTTPAETMRTFAVAYDEAGVKVRFLRSESGALVEPPATISPFSLGGGASDGTRMFMVFRTDQGAGGGLIDPASGNFQNPGVVTLGGTAGSAISNVWYDGKSYLVGLRTTPAGSATSTYSVRRFSTAELFPLDNSLPGAGALMVPEYVVPNAYSAVAGDGTGRSLFVYTVTDPIRVGTAIKARLINNDGLPADGSVGAGGTDGADGSTSSDGSLGTGGVAGEAGSDGGVDAGGTAGSAGAGGGVTGGSAGSAGSGGGGPAGAAGSSGTGGGSVGSGPADASRDGAAGSANASGADPGGCGCRQAASSKLGATGVLLAGFGLALARRRKRRRIDNR